MEKNEQSGIPDPDVVVSPDDPDIVVSPDDKINFFVRRNNNDLESSSSKYEKHQPNDTKIAIELLEEILRASLKNIHEPGSKCRIYKVPKDLRKINEEAYTPQVISIGPFHHGKKEFSEMENKKLIYVSEFGIRVGEEKLKEFIRFIYENERIIRNCYQEKSTLTSPKFVSMILRDAVFIIELFLKNIKEPVRERKFDLFLDAPYVRVAITRDLQLLENQLPYFILKHLFEKVAFLTKADYPDPFLILSHRFFFNPKDGDFPKSNNEIQQYEIQHFTDLRRYFLLMNFLPRDQMQREHARYLPTATNLHASGVKFKGIEGGSSLEITCEYVPRAIRIPYIKLQIPYFKACELRIPRLEIDDWSECLYRNMMALELCHYPFETHICNFILLMNFLINTEKDVDLLVDKGIIFSRLGDNATAATMFNNLSFQITTSHPVYHDICNKLKEHCERGWNRTMATLNTVYFGDIWTGTKTVAAVILLVLTFIQTVYSIL